MIERCAKTVELAFYLYSMQKKKKIIVSVTNDLSTDQRVHKVCSFLEEKNWEVHLVGRKLRSSLELNRSYDTTRMRLWFNKGPFFYANYNLRLFFFLIFHKSDVLLSNDLDTLLANFCASKLRRKQILVYDSHELYTEVPELINRPKVQAVWKRIEQWIFPKLNHVYTVNESIAHIYSKKYNVPVKVVRNISPLWKPIKILSKQELGLPENKKIIILQGAGINIDRGAEEAVEAMKYLNESVLFLIVGTGDVIPQLQKQVKQQGLTEKVWFLGRKPYQEMMNYTYHADLGLTLDKGTNANYKYSLPNKLFDYIHTETPVIASDLVEVKRIVTGFNVGLIVSSHDPEVIAETIKQLFTDPKKLEELKQNCKRAQQHLTWEKETNVLNTIFEAIN